MENVKELLRFSASAESDGTIGIPLDVRTYHNGNTNVMSPVVLYAVNTNTERIGTDSDENIIRDMVNNKGLIVVVLDYKNSEKASPPALDWSIQKIRGEINANGTYLNGAEYKKNYSYAVPSGYNITLDEYYWSIDRHGSDGCIEKIVEIWNNDFRGVKAERVVSYPDGTTEKIKNIEAKSIYDCVRDDGRQLDLDLRMDIIYPTNPKNKVPIMTVYSSSEIRIGAWTSAMRPHLTGFLFSGYAGAVFDYGYTPMARTDHYGYFDGNGLGCKGNVTGDNYTYSLDVFTGVKQTTAAIRHLRWLADNENSIYKFDVDKIGVYGNSKGGLATRLGMKNAEEQQEQRTFVGHHGETRYENGKTETVRAVNSHGTEYVIHGGEEQPWLTYRDGGKIPSNVQFIYTNCGGGWEDITSGHAPTFASGSMKDGSYPYFFASVVNLCRIYDVPCLSLSFPELAHALVYGSDKDYGIDGYQALFDMANYYLKGDGAFCEYVDASELEGKYPTLKIKFSGEIPSEQIVDVTVKNTLTGENVEGCWSCSSGKTEWDFHPNCIQPGAEYDLTVPDSIICANGQKLRSAMTFGFKTSEEKRLSAEYFDGEKCEFNVTEKGSNYLLRFCVENDASNVAEIYADGLKVCEIPICGKGKYEYDVTEQVRSADGKRVCFEIRQKKTPEFKILKKIDFGSSDMGVNGIDGLSLGARVKGELSELDGIKALKIEHMTEILNFKDYHTYLAKNEPMLYMQISDSLTDSDLGRRFGLSFDIYDTDVRHINAYITPWTNKDIELIDWKAKLISDSSEKDAWKAYSFDWRVDDEKYIKSEQRTLQINAESRGAEENKPIYIANIVLSETVTDIEISKEDGCVWSAPKLIVK